MVGKQITLAVTATHRKQINKTLRYQTELS